MVSLQKQENKRLLVVDDEEDVLEFLKIYLESLGWVVITASSTTDAFVTLQSTHCFMVLSDIAMPDMDGYEFMNRILELKIPVQVAVMTGFGYNPNHTLVKINKTLHYPCLFKPFNRKKLAEVVQQAWNTYHADVSTQISPSTPTAP